MRCRDPVSIAQREGISVPEARETIARVRRFKINNEHSLSKDLLACFVKEAGNESDRSKLTFNARYQEGKDSPARQLEFHQPIKEENTYEDIPDWMKEAYPDGWSWAVDNGVADFLEDPAFIVPRRVESSSSVSTGEVSEVSPVAMQAGRLASAANAVQDFHTRNRHDPNARTNEQGATDEDSNKRPRRDDTHNGPNHVAVETTADTQTPFCISLEGLNPIKASNKDPSAYLLTDGQLKSVRVARRLRNQERNRSDSVAKLANRMYRFHRLTLSLIQLLVEDGEGSRCDYASQEMFAEKVGNLSYQICLSKKPVHLMSWQQIKLEFMIETDEVAMFVQKLSLYEETSLKCMTTDIWCARKHVVAVFRTKKHGICNCRIAWYAFCRPKMKFDDECDDDSTYNDFGVLSDDNAI